MVTYVNLLDIVSAPLWNTKTCTFAGLLTASDFINVIQYYHQNVSYVQALEDIGKLKLNGLRGRAFVWIETVFLIGLD